MIEHILILQYTWGYIKFHLYLLMVLFIFDRGVAARALHLSRGMEKPSGRVTYTVVLEGWCRFNVQEMNTRGTYNTASVVQLDMTRTGKSQHVIPR